jgi:phenylpyruvate tautomerase PptA (4-oxalocrotonate tautomerase family)
METSLTYVCIQELEDNGYVMEADRLTQRTEADLIQE